MKRIVNILGDILVGMILLFILSSPIWLTWMLLDDIKVVVGDLYG